MKAKSGQMASRLLSLLESFVYLQGGAKLQILYNPCPTVWLKSSKGGSKAFYT